MLDDKAIDTIEQVFFNRSAGRCYSQNRRVLARSLEIKPIAESAEDVIEVEHRFKNARARAKEQMKARVKTIPVSP
jgi:hypothetical protein